MGAGTAKEVPWRIPLGTCSWSVMSFHVFQSVVVMAPYL